MGPSWKAVAARLAPSTPVSAVFDPAETEACPEPVRRYFAGAVAPGTPLAPAVRLSIRGEIRLGGHWRPFRSQEVCDPLRGLVWWGRVAGIVSGGDYALADGGRLEWRLLGLKRVAFATGDDVVRSGLARGFAEGCLWAPTAVLPRAGVTWDAVDDRQITATARTPYDTVVHRITLDDDGRIVAGVFDRWGDPGGTGTSALHPFGGVVTDWRTFDGVTIASRGAAGWWFGTDRWAYGEFFRYEVEECSLLLGRR